jgi:hypothetical protein
MVISCRSLCLKIYFSYALSEFFNISSCELLMLFACKVKSKIWDTYDIVEYSNILEFVNLTSCKKDFRVDVHLASFIKNWFKLDARLTPTGPKIDNYCRFLSD